MENRLSEALDYCKLASKNRPKVLRKKPVNEITQRSGYIYFIQCHDFVKVGLGINPDCRLAQMQVGNPYELKLLRYFKVDSMAEAESRIHQFWLNYHVRGEWFRVPEMQLKCAIRASSFEHIFR